MRLPLSWLKEFVTVSGTPEALADRITVAGLPVERIERSAVPETVIVGRVLAVEPHPNADRLRVATVDCGTKNATIVCGAPNLAAGQKVAIALPGTTLPNGTTIRDAAIRGVKSAGMICAEDELGLGGNHSGIIVLPSTAALGAPAATVLGSGDVVFDLEVTPNRADCLSILGCAREIAALTKKTVRVPRSERRDRGKLPVRELTVRVRDRRACPYYAARVIDAVTIGPSPDWLQRRLVAAGVRPLNNVIDVTNSVMLELGQPLHAFDAAALVKKTIVVRRAAAGESIAALDGKTYPLSNDTLVIASAAGPLAIAGVMGGQSSGITNETTRVVLEAALFDPILIRRASKRLGLTSESSYRFERGIDAHQTIAALDRAATLLSELAQGTVLPGRSVVGAKPRAPLPVPLSVDRMNQMLSLTLTPAATAAHLKRLGATVRGRGRRVRVVPPTWRRDLTIEEDLIEEVGRIVGYPELTRTLPTGILAPVVLPPLWRLKQDCSDTLAALGGTEIKSYPFLADPTTHRLFPETATPLRLKNPLNREQSFLRTELLPNLLAKAALAARDHPMVFLYEIGGCFAESGAALPAETERVALVVVGPDPYRELKGIAKAALEALEVPPGELDIAVRARPGGETLSLKKTVIGHLTLLPGELRTRYKFRAPVAAAELLLEPLVGLRRLPRYQPFPPYPPLRRDLAFWVAKEVRASDVMRIVRTFDPLLVESEVFDVFEERERRSFALHLTFLSPKRTLTAAEVDAIIARLTNALTDNVRAEIRRS